MALIYCPECGKEVSSDAPSCLHCGYPLGVQSQQPISKDLDYSDSADTTKEQPCLPAKKKFPLGKVVLIYIVSFFAICFIGFQVISPGNQSEHKSVPGELEAVTYAQITVKEYFPNAKMELRTKPYTVVATGLRYKIEGKAVIEDVSHSFVVVIEFDDDSYDSYTIKSVQIGSTKYMG